MPETKVRSSTAGPRRSTAPGWGAAEIPSPACSGFLTVSASGGTGHLDYLKVDKGPSLSLPVTKPRRTFNRGETSTDAFAGTGGPGL